jgi:hypothetical protein
MKKLLFMIVAGFGVMSRWSFPVPVAIQRSPVHGMVTTLVIGQPRTPNQARSATGNGQVDGPATSGNMA